MPLESGQILSHYRLVEQIGEGGMGVVWRAQDTKLDRDVAVKFLPEAFSEDPDRLARFEREAKLLASLNHPNIAAIHGLEDADGIRFLVLELIPGDTLAERVARGPLAVEEALRLGRQIAEALEVAHSNGVLHRDLKPANVKVTPDGTVKVLDFGLAKALGPELSDTEAANSPTRTMTAATRAGIIMGTAAYMAPEQIRNHRLDGRTDIFAFGIVLYELLTGRHPFQRTTAIETMAAILHDTVSTPAELPVGVCDLLMTLLIKDIDARPTSFTGVLTTLASLASVPLTFETPANGGKRTAFVGRDTEQTELQRLLAQVQGGRGALVLIGGEPGVGKTRLAEELLGHARQRGLRTLVGHCYEQEGAQPFIPFIEAFEQMARLLPTDRLREMLGDAAPEVARLVPELRQLLPDLPPPIELPPEQQRRYLFNNVQEFLGRVTQERSIVWLLDDLHWADESSLELLLHLVSHLDTLPILLLGTYRDVELEVGRPFERVLATMVRQRQAQRIALKRLSNDAVAELLAALAGQEVPDSSDWLVMIDFRDGNITNSMIP